MSSNEENVKTLQLQVEELQKEINKLVSKVNNLPDTHDKNTGSVQSWSYERRKSFVRDAPKLVVSPGDVRERSAIYYNHRRRFLGYCMSEGIDTENEENMSFMIGSFAIGIDYSLVNNGVHLPNPTLFKSFNEYTRLLLALALRFSD